MTAPPSRYVETDSNERLKLARAYTAAECVGQLVENAAAVLKRFNATLCVLSVLSGVAGQICNPLRPVDSPDATHVTVIKSDALQVVDNGLGFLFDHVRTMLRSGYRYAHTFTKLFGANNQGLKQLCSKLSPAWALLFSKSKDQSGVIWCTIVGFGSNFDVSGALEFVAISWPASEFNNDWRKVAALKSFLANDSNATKHLFRSNGGESWAPLESMREANKYFKEIQGTGVLGLFPFNQPLQGKPQPALQVEVTNEAIRLQGDNLVEYLDRYFVAPEMGLLPPEYWDDAGWAGFEMKLKVLGGYKICKPYMPSFPISKPIEIEIGDQTHTMVYGPHFSEGHDTISLFPYADNAGFKFFSQNYQTYLVSNSRVMNHNSPYRPQYDLERTDYFDFVQKTSLKRTSETLKIRFRSMCCGRDNSDEPAKFGELMDLLDDMKVFDPQTPYLADNVYSSQLKNLQWLLGAPLEIFIRIDGKMLMNEQKDDLMRDTLVRDMFYGSAHIELCLDLLHRFKPGLDHRKAEVDKQRAAGNHVQRNAVSPKTPQQKARAKPRGTARKPAANKKRTADAPFCPPSAKRRPRPSTPSSATAVAQEDQRATGLEILTAAAEQKRKNPTPSMSHDDATSGSGAPNKTTAMPDDQFEHSEDAPIDREAAGPSHERQKGTLFGAKYGPSSSLHTKAIKACLDSGDKEVIGVIANLATVANQELSEVLAEVYFQALGYVVVKSGACRDRLVALLQTKKLPIPDILSYEHLLPYGGDYSTEAPAGCGDQARALMTAACSGSDEALAVPLPHESTFGAEDWPEGCLGYAFNLVRPTMPGLRAWLLAKVLGSTLVFATIAEAAEYRKYLVQEKQMECGEIITLDSGCINSIGVTLGASFKPASLQYADRRFGTDAGQQA